MKAKLVLITYLNNGNMQSQIGKEFTFNRVMNEMTDEGREVAHSVMLPFEKRVVFEDGSKVVCVPFSMANRGMKITHLFVDGALSSLPNGDEIMTQCLMSIINFESKDFDTSEKDRAFKFNFEDGTVNIAKLA